MSPFTLPLGGAYLSGQTWPGSVTAVYISTELSSCQVWSSCLVVVWSISVFDDGVEGGGEGCVDTTQITQIYESSTGIMTEMMISARILKEEEPAGSARWRSIAKLTDRCLRSLCSRTYKRADFLTQSHTQGQQTHTIAQKHTTDRQTARQIPGFKIIIHQYPTQLWFTCALKMSPAMWMMPSFSSSDKWPQSTSWLLCHYSGIGREITSSHFKRMPFLIQIHSQWITLI